MSLDFLAPFGGDLSLGSNVDIALLGKSNDFDFITDRDELIQRLIRRLLTSSGEWIPFPQYGAGLRALVNETLTQQMVLQIRSTVVSQILQEPDIARNPMPHVNVQATLNGVFVSVQFFTQALEPVAFNFNPAAPNTFQTVRPEVGV